MTLDYFQNEFKMVNFYVKAVILYGPQHDESKEEEEEREKWTKSETPMMVRTM